MFSFNGFGTTLYGHADKRSDGSYVATKWIIIFFVPIIPLGSYRIFSKEGNFFSFHKEYRLKPVALNKKQVLKTYLLLLGIVLLLKVIFSLIYCK
ncbi:MAG: hypothetical protein LBR36_04100 [Bacteroidales bacterium]|jgi:hypothetical protein|nr:hypothetical protein [Bacteroidales bacterium]